MKLWNIIFLLWPKYQCFLPHQFRGTCCWAKFASWVNRNLKMDILHKFEVITELHYLAYCAIRSNIFKGKWAFSQSWAMPIWTYLMWVVREDSSLKSWNMICIFYWTQVESISAPVHLPTNKITICKTWYDPCVACPDIPSGPKRKNSLKFPILFYFFNFLYFQIF